MTVYLIAWYDKVTLNPCGMSQLGYMSESEAREEERRLQASDKPEYTAFPGIFYAYVKPYTI